MKKLWLALGLMATISLFSCKSAGNDPKATLTAFFDALSKKDMVTARKLATEDSKPIIDLIEMGMNMAKDKKEDAKFDKSKMEFSEPKIEGDKATIAVKEKGSEESMNYTLKKVDGTWKVAFDKSSLMNMGMEKLNEQGVDAEQEVKKAMDEMKDVNIDSLTKSVEQELKKMDTVQ